MCMLVPQQRAERASEEKRYMLDYFQVLVGACLFIGRACRGDWDKLYRGARERATGYGLRSNFVFQ